MPQGIWYSKSCKVAAIDCNYYHNYRQNCITKIEEIFPYFEILQNEEKLVLCINTSLIKLTIKFICDFFTKRQKAIFN